MTNDQDQKFSQAVIKNMQEMFFDPEIAKRKQAGLLPNDFQLLAAQVIFFPDARPYEIRLNEKVTVEVKLKKGVNSKQENFWPSVQEVERIMLNDESLFNCGHSTMVLFRDGFLLSFDFHYNKNICTEHLSVAAQFLNTSKFSLDNAFLFSFIDNSFSTIELLAKTNLLIEANNGILNNPSHKTIKAAFNLRFKNAVTDFEKERRSVFNKLSDARAKARYLEGSVNFERKDLELIYQTIQAMYYELCNRADIQPF